MLFSKTAFAFLIPFFQIYSSSILQDGKVQLRQTTVAKPVVTIVGSKNMKLTDSRMALTVQISAAAAGSNIRYTLNGTSPKCRRNPVGTTYTGPIQICGSPVPIRLQAIACTPNVVSGESSSDIVSEVFNVQAFQPPAPVPPGFNFDPRSGCSHEDDLWTCAVQYSNSSITFSLTTDDMGCNSSDFAAEADCIAQGYIWATMPRCTTSPTARPCQDVSPFIRLARSDQQGRSGIRIKIFPLTESQVTA